MLRAYPDAGDVVDSGIMVKRAIYDSVPASCHKYLMTDLLRDQWGLKASRWAMRGMWST